MSIQNNFPAIKPSLNLDFSNTKTVDPRITFTRASSATYFDEFGVMRTTSNNVPRIDHNPMTGECLGLLIEEQRTNLLPYSEQFDDAGWVKLQTTITPNTIVAPNGTLTASKIVNNTSNAWHTLTRNGISFGIQTVSFSVYAKAGELSTLQIVPNGTYFPTAYANFDLVNGTVSVSSGLDSASISSVGGGWFRCSITDTNTSSVSANAIYVSAQNSS